ncbi:hypothetical protein KKG66_02380 [bacterium]|nr:hypothetical protein [bacterium]
MVILRFAVVFILFSRMAFSGELVIAEFPVPENDPQGYARVRKPEMIHAVMEDALRAEDFGGLEIDSAEWRESIPSERKKTPFRVVKHEEIPSEQAGGHLNIYEFTVDSAGIAVYRFAVNGIQKDPYRFRVFDEGWTLEVKNYRRAEADGWSDEVDYAVILNGIELNQSLELDACWGYRHLGNSPFFFFDRGGQVGWRFDAREIISDYASIVHDRCCKDVLMNPQFFYNAVSFFAERDGQWYQVIGMVSRDNK